MSGSDDDEVVRVSESSDVECDGDDICDEEDDNDDGDDDDGDWDEQEGSSSGEEGAGGRRKQGNGKAATKAAATKAAATKAAAAKRVQRGASGVRSVGRRARRGARGAKSEESGDEEPSVAAIKAANVAAVLRGDVEVCRRALLPRMLSVSQDAAVLRRPFKSPCPGATTNASPELLRRLAACRRFVAWGGGVHRRPLLVAPAGDQGEGEDAEEGEAGKGEEEAQAAAAAEAGYEPLVLWVPEEDPFHACEDSQPIAVDPILAKCLRAHQREGVAFMFECVAGLKDFHQQGDDDQGCYGCILADDMGLGKTLQSIALLWTLLKQGFEGPKGPPLVRRAVIVTPTSLVSNWAAELDKWLGARVRCVALCEATRADALKGIQLFLAPRGTHHVLIVSYETFRMHATAFHHEGACDLVICDEAHRLKNDRTLTTQALAGLPCRRRVLLSGTPMQNDLEEFYAMVSFTNPGVLSNAAHFRRHFQAPILAGREPHASEEERALGAQRSAELSDRVNQFILRRTNALLSNHLPPKIVEIVCCRMTDLQRQLYERFIHSKNVRTALEDGKKARALASITALKKLCNHPKLLYDSIRGGGAEAAGFEDALPLFPPAMFNERSGAWTGGGGAWVQLSGKMVVLARLLAHLRTRTTDRIVLVSNYTQTLDLFAQLCREHKYPFVRLDGGTSVGKRQKLVQQFNDPHADEFVFLLSSKAGGCGLNLIGGNRLVLFDPDWNPANDKQAAARVWRDGQKKRVFVYRFLAAGTIEEKVFQRQMAKEGLQQVVDNEKQSEGRAQVNLLSAEELRDLFVLRSSTLSDTHDSLGCQRCPSRPSLHAAGRGGCHVGAQHKGGGAGGGGKGAKVERRGGGSLEALAAVAAGEGEGGGGGEGGGVRGGEEEEGDREEGSSGVESGGREKAEAEGSDEDDVQAGRGSNGGGKGQNESDIGGFAAVAGVAGKLKEWEKQVGNPLEEQLDQWAHHSRPSATIPDTALQKAACLDVTFVFSYDDARAGDNTDLRKQIVQSAPRATVDELASASQMARLSALVYHRDPAPHVSALGLTLRACQQTPFTAYMVVDSPPCPREGGRTRYVIARGVAVDRSEVHLGRLWRQLLQVRPVHLERALTPPGVEVLVHGGVHAIAEDVYRGVLPLLAADMRREGITHLRFGGHSLGGSLALLLMLMFHLRSPNTRADASPLHLSAHTFGSFPVLASLSSSPSPSAPHSLSHQFAHSSGDLSRLLASAHAHPSSPLLHHAAGRPAATAHTTASWPHTASPHLHAPPPGLLSFPHAPLLHPSSPFSSSSSSSRGAARCSVLASLGLPSEAARAFVLDRDIIPRAFLLAHPLCSAFARTPLLRSLLGLHPSTSAPPLSTGLSWDPLAFQAVGLVHYMQATGSESMVASLPPALAEKALAMGVGELVRDPLMLARSIRDHCFNHYVHFLDSALHAARHTTLD
ncbi:unnamed protein product [Closterium sp. Yama58-4]|nr:unnamed protein product [Closterium sp. Yama58-4]